ncbi:hypothetical protein BDV27DRAFT_139727 [Aspergillus caelatus]|uniref:Single domain-containing protein n=1 Tax=Aspergillus caelatus TaxID=61420 RepID=A0A5N6ZHV8_9EURO|nr:uncharacterized protein BDV27DRAFT_139727 [Aspergillus caelatus]KAE8357232.1 hypothetical protein BDV27DRAFT_139727 [Aspergillus caelatus]
MQICLTQLSLWVAFASCAVLKNNDYDLSHLNDHDHDVNHQLFCKPGPVCIYRDCWRGQYRGSFECLGPWDACEGCVVQGRMSYVCCGTSPIYTEDPPIRIEPGRCCIGVGCNPTC